MIYIGNIEILTAKSAIYLGNVGLLRRRVAAEKSLHFPTEAAGLDNGLLRLLQEVTMAASQALPSRSSIASPLFHKAHPTRAR